MGKAPLSLGALVSRYSAVVIFPSITILSIYADLRHTRLWKESLKEEQKNQGSI